MNPNPFTALMHSRKFWLAVFGVVQTIVLYYLDIPRDIWLSIDTLVGVVIVAITVEDNSERKLQASIYDSDQWAETERKQNENKAS